VRNVKREHDFLNEFQIRRKHKKEKKSIEFYRVKIHAPYYRKNASRHIERYTGGPMRENFGMLKRKYTRKEKLAI